MFDAILGLLATAHDTVRDHNLGWSPAIAGAAAAVADKVSQAGYTPTWVTYIGAFVAISGGVCQIYQTILRHHEVHGRTGGKKGHPAPRHHRRP